MGAIALQRQKRSEANRCHGHIAGGLAAAFVALRHSEVFGNVVSQSGAFAGSLNRTVEYAVESTRHLRDVLLARGYQVQNQQFVAGHDGLSWRGALADGLIELFGVH